jgi:phospholipid N-methyltransferase
MSQFVESLTRLYQNNRIDETKLKELLTTNKINQQEYNYIVSAKEAV